MTERTYSVALATCMGLTLVYDDALNVINRIHKLYNENSVIIVITNVFLQ